MSPLKNTLILSYLVKMEINGYKIGDFIGNGNEGNVYRAQKNGKNMALKIYYTKVDKRSNQTFYIPMKKMIQRFKKNKNYPKSLVKWYDIFIAKHKGIDRYIMAMEHIPGYSLSHIVNDKGWKITYNFIKTLFLDLLNVCKWSYDTGMTVFDLKVDSVLVVDDHSQHPKFRIVDLCYLHTLKQKEIDNELCKDEDCYGPYAVSVMILSVLFGPVKAHTYIAHSKNKEGDSDYLKRLFSDSYFPYLDFPSGFVKALEICIFDRFTDPSCVIKML